MKDMDVFVVGVAIDKFIRPEEDTDIYERARRTCIRALEDCRLTMSSIEHVCLGSAFGGHLAGQRFISESVQVTQVINSAITGAMALKEGVLAIQSGFSNCVMVCGMDRMFSKVEECTLATQFAAAKKKKKTRDGFPFEAFYDNLMNGILHNQRELLNENALRHLKIGVLNDNALYNRDRDPEFFAIKGSHIPQTHKCSRADGTAAVILANFKFVQENNLTDQAILIASIASSFEKLEDGTVDWKKTINVAATKALTNSGLVASDVSVAEISNYNTAIEILFAIQLGLVKDEGSFMSSMYRINPSGGDLTMGLCFGASGVSKCVELYNQFRKRSGRRQIVDPHSALQLDFCKDVGAIVTTYKKLSRRMAKRLRTSPGAEGIARRGQPPAPAHAEGHGNDDSDTDSELEGNRLAPVVELMMQTEEELVVQPEGDPKI